MALAVIAAPAGAAPNGAQDIVLGSGSDTTYLLMQDIDNLYNGAIGCNTTAVTGQTQKRDFTCIDPPTAEELKANPDHDIIAEAFPQGSSNGISHLAAVGGAGVTKIDFARSSRARRPTDSANLRFVAFAREALTWAVFRNQGLPINLTNAQITNIHLGCTNPTTWINNWKQVGGPDRPIILYTSQNGSGTRASWDAFVGGDSTSCIPAEFKDGNPANGERIIFENNATRVAAADRPGAFYHYSAGRFRETRGAGTYLGSVNGITPSIANVRGGTFPFSRFVYNVYRKGFAADNASAAVIDYLGVADDGKAGWLCRSDADHAISLESGKRYGIDIKRAMNAHGFAELEVEPTGGGVTGSSKCRVS